MAFLLLSSTFGPALAQQTLPTLPSAAADCTASALNRTAPVQSDFSFTIYNLPGAAGIVGPAALLPPPPPAPFRVRVSCSDGTVGETELAFPEFGSTVVYTGDIYWRPATPIPLGLSLTAAMSRLTTGQTTQLAATGILANAATVDLSRRDKGTLFTSSNPDLASVTENGLVTVSALFASGSSSRVVMAAQNEGVQATTLLQLGPRGSLSGHIYRADGVTPVANAQVSVVRNQPRDTVATVQTNASGAFAIADVSAGQFSVSVIDPSTGDMGRGVGAIQSDGEAGVANVRLNGQGTVTVKVLDGNGAPVANAQVTYTSLTGFRDVRTLSTDSAGNAVFNGALAGSLTVSTRDGGSGLVGTASAQLAVGASVVVSLKLQPVAALQGTVLGSDGATVQEGIQVRLVSLVRGIVSQVVTGPDGKFRFEPLPLADGPFTLDAMQDGRLKARVPGIIPTSGGQVLTQNVQFAPAGLVKGVVRLGDGSLSAGATVTVQSLVGQRFSFTAKTNAQGQYTVDGIPVGAFSMTVSGTGGETATGAGTLASDGDVSVVDLQLASNGLVGTVYLRDGVTAAGAGVTVTLNPGNRSVLTNAAGQFGFTLSQPNSYSIDAADALGNKGRTSLVITTIDPQNPTAIKVVFLAQGAVSGTVRDASGTVQPNVAVTLNSSSLFGGSLSTTTDATGRYSFASVFAGDFTVSARNAATQLAGYASARITADGQNVPVDVTLAATGSVTGRVFLRDGVTPVAGVQLTLQPNGSSSAVATTTADASGNYGFTAVPIGEFTVDATDPSTGDRGRSGSRVTTAGENRVLNLQLLGQGSVVVTARTNSGVAVEGAVVTLNSSSLFGGNFNAVTNASGMATFTRVFNGDFSVSAVKGSGISRLSGTGQGAVANSASTSLALTMTSKPVGRIAGLVNKGLSAAPVAGVTVQLRRVDNGQVTQQVITGADGAYAFEAVEGETSWRLVARVNDRVRAQIDGLSIATDGETLTRDLTLLGVGKVTGRTLDAGGQPLAGMRVEVNNPDPVYGNRSNVTSQADGTYSVSDVPAGKFSIRANNNSGSLQAESSGTVRFDADTVTIDLNLVDNAVTMPRTLYEANENAFTVQGDGSLSGGTSSVFGSGNGADVRAARLELLVNGIPVPFANGDGSVGRRLMDGQLLEVDETSVATGLQITRRTYVPRDGYFARHVEVLENRGTAPVTVGLRITSNFAQGVVGSRVVDTSDGDAVVSVSDGGNRDRWAVIDDDRDADPFLEGGIPSTAVIFDGAGAPAQVSNASVQAMGLTAKLSYEWTNVTVQPGQSVAYMHFTAQQLGRIPARDAALRLSQLPPEALQGLTVQELATIRNFNVPADGLSQVPALPTVVGSTVTGQVLSGDGRTPIPNAKVQLQGLHSLYGRKYTVQANAQGQFSFASANLGGSSAVAIAQDRVQMRATHPRTGALTANAVVGFAAGDAALKQDMIFVGTGNLRGVVTRHTGTLITNGTVSMQYRFPGGSVNTLSADVGADGSYAYTGIDPGDYPLTASQPHPQGKPVQTGTAVIVAVPAGETTVRDLTLQPTGSVTGVVYNAAAAPVAGASVSLDPDPWSGPYRSMTTDTGGRYRFDDVAVGPHAVVASGSNGLNASGAVTVAQDAPSVSDLTLGGLGTARVLVQYQRGASAPGTFVSWSPRGSSGYTDATGLISMSLRVGDTYTVTARHPDNSDLSNSLNVTLTQNAEVSDFTLALPAAGTITGTVVRENGSSLAPGVTVTIRKASNLAVVTTRSTDSAGRYTVRGLVAGSYLLTAEDRTNLTYIEGSAEITSDGQEVQANLRLQDNRIALPTKLFDGNSFGFEVSANAAYRAWQLNEYGSVTSGPQLEIDGIAFTGDTSAFLEAGRRQLVVSQAQALTGLKVTRKIYVPQGGYFARYLEVLENAGAAPVTVSVKLKHKLNPGMSVVGTSSGDTLLSTTGADRDLWTVIDDTTDADPFTNWGYASLATVLADANASAKPDQLGFVPNSPSEMAAGWSSVTVPANGRVALMHFDVQQLNRAGARFAAERLSQLPPEALQYLTTEEITAIANFSVPADGQSAVPAMPSLLGNVSGRVLEGNGTTAVPNTTVNVRSLHPLYGRTWTYNNWGDCYQRTESTLRASATGAYSLAGRVADQYAIPLPVDYPVEVSANKLSCEYYMGHPLTHIAAPMATATFSGSAAQANVVFPSGILTGTVTGPADYGAGSGEVKAVVNGNEVNVSLTSDGTYVMPGMPAGSYDLSATVYHNQGTDLLGSRNATAVTVGQITVADITIEATGSITGVVTTPSGEPVVDADVDIRAAGNRYIDRLSWTDSLGRYAFSAVPVGIYTVTITDNRTQARTTSTLTVTQNQATTHNVTVIGTGSLPIQVNFARGVAAANANVYLTSPSVGSERNAGRTDNLGKVNILVPVGTYSLRVVHPERSALNRTLTGTVTEHNQAIPLTVSLPALASVRLTVVNGDGGNAVVSNARVSVTDALRTDLNVGSTNGSGQYLITGIPEGPYSVTARATDGMTASVVGTVSVADDGKTLERTATVTAANDLLGVFTYGDERQLYAVQLAAGDHLDLRISGAQVGQTTPLYLTRAQVYSPNLTQVARGYGYGPDNSYVQYNELNNLQDVVAQAAGSYTIALAPYYTNYTGGFRLHLAVNGVPVVAQAAPGATLSGRLLSAAGAPAASQKLRIRAYGTPTMNVERITDAAGNYRVDGVPAGYVEIRRVTETGGLSDVLASGYAPSSGAMPLDVVIPTTMTINVDVRDGSGVPVPNARVSFSPPGYTYYTNVAGQTSFTYTGAQSVTVTATHPSNSLIAASQVVPLQTGTFGVSLTLSSASITGTVQTATGEPASGVYVFVRRAQGYGFLVSTYADSSGMFTFPVLPAGVEVEILTQDPRTDVMVKRRMTPTAGQAITGVVMSYPAAGSIVGRVTINGSSPRVNQMVSASYMVDDAYGSKGYRTGYTNQNGEYVIEGGLPVGAVIDLETNYATFGGLQDRTPTRQVTLTAEGEAGRADFDVSDISGGTLSIRTLAADGQNVPSSYCSYSVESGESREDIWYVRCDRNAQLLGVPAGNVTISHLMGEGSSNWQRGSVTVAVVNGQATSAVVPVSLVKGKVTHVDGAHVSYPEVFVTREDGSSVYPYLDSYETGEYRLLGLPVGTFNIEAQDTRNSGLKSSKTVAMVAPAEPVTSDFVLPASGSVHGVVRDAQGTPLPNAQIYLRSSGLDFDRYIDGDESGAYSVDHVALGDVSIFVRDYQTNLVGTATVALNAGGQSVTLNASLPAAASLTGRVLMPDGAPVPQAEVSVRSISPLGPFGPFNSYVTADANGVYSFAVLPAVEFDVQAEQSGLLGAGRVTTVAGSMSTLDLTMGGVVRLPAVLKGSDTSVYDVTCEGALDDGGYQGAGDAYDSMYYLQVNGQSYGCAGSAEVRQGLREVVLPVTQLSGLKTQRRVYVPASGGYARYLDSFVNDTAQQIVVPVSISGNLGSDSATRLVVAPSSNGNHYAVTADNGSDPALAHVFGGAGAAASSLPQFSRSADNLSYVWNVTVPPGGRISLLHFAVQAAPGDTDAAASRAQSLSDGTDVNMFSGLDAVDRSSIINFVVPQ